MVQVLPRFCLRCNTPLQRDMQRCANCNLSIEAMLSRSGNKQSETSKYGDTVSQGAITPISRYREQQENKVPPNYQSGKSAPARPTEPSRFLPASPLPLEPSQWNEPDKLDIQQCWSAQQAPRFIPTQLLTSELPDDTSPASSPDTSDILLSDKPAIPPVEATPSCPDKKQSEPSAYDDAALLEAIAPTPRRVRLEKNGEENKSLSMPSEAQDSQIDQNTPGESVKSPQPPPILPLPPEPGEQQYKEVLPSIPPEMKSNQPDQNARGEPVKRPQLPPILPPPPEPGKWNEFGGRLKASIAFIGLALLLILASGGYIVFSGHLPSLNTPWGTGKTIDDNGAVDVQKTATATYPYVSGGTLVFSDTLKAANSNWDRNAGCAFKGGSYHVTTTTIQSCMLNANISLTDFVLEVKVTLLQGDTGGLFFREDKLYNRSNAYLLDFDSKGNYQLWNYSVSNPAKMIGHGTSSNLKTGYNRTNTIALVAQGTNFTLYINGQTVKRFVDNTYNIGGLSLVSSEYSNHQGVSEAAYSDLRLWQL